MNNHDSIKFFINVNLIIIIICFSILTFFNLRYSLISHQHYDRLIFEAFIIYFMIDIMIDINDESELFFEKKYQISHYKVTRIIRKV